MKRFNWQVILGLLLTIISASIYIIHYALFKDSHHIFIYLLGDIAFLPIDVLLVTLIIHRVLGMREKRAMLEKMNMVIGAFFSEVGTELLKILAEFDPNIDKNSKELVVKSNWSNRKFVDTSKSFKDYDYEYKHQPLELDDLKIFLSGKRDFLLRLLENPNLLEHEAFTDLLWAVLHLTEELSNRKALKLLPDTDYAHLSGDMKRAYKSLISEWLIYMKHLKNNYPYLFSLAIRINPLDKDASPIVE